MNALSLFKSNNKEKKSANKSEDNPYLTARRTWNDHVGSILTAKQVWQVVALISLLIALASVGGIIYIGQQSKFVPYIVEVNKLGEPTAFAPAQRASQPDIRVIRAQVADFIASSRMVTPDIALQRKAVFGVYALLAANDAAMMKMNEWYQANKPFERAASETVDINIRSVMPQTEQTWQVDWIETIRDRNGGIKSRANWRALVTVYHIPVTSKTSEKQLRENPIGTYVRDFSWSKQI